MSKTWKITVDEEEMYALIEHHSIKHSINHGDGFKVERSARIHDLTKRLNKKDEPEIEVDQTKTETVPQAWS